MAVYLLEMTLGQDNLEEYCRDLEMTIGAFSLDPTRVIDMILEVYSMNLDNDLYLEVLERCGAHGHYHKLMGMKFKQWAKSAEHQEKPVQEKQDLGESSSSAPPSGTPLRLFRLAAILIAKGYMIIGELLPHISLPQKENTVMMKNFHKYVRGKHAEAKDLAAASLMEEGGSFTLQSKPYRQELPSLKLPDYYVHNQELQMLGALLQQNDLSSAYPLMKKNAELQIFLHPEVQGGLLSLLEHFLSEVCPNDTSFFGVPKKRAYSEDDISIIRLQIYPLLQYLEVGLSENPSVTIKVARLMADIAKSGYKGELGANHACDDPQNIYFHIVCILFRSRCLMSANSQFSSILWSILKSLKYSDRFAVYENILQGYKDIFLMQQHGSVVSKRTNDILKKMTKDDAKVKSRLLVQFIHSNPLIVCDKIVSQAQAYENLIEPMSELVRWFHPEAFDEMTYIMLKRIEPEGYKARLKPDDATVQNWITNVGTFAGKLLRKYSYSYNQLFPIIHYIFCKFKLGVWEDSTLLIEILKEVVNEELVEDISKEQLQAFGGGKTLQKLAASFQESGSEITSESTMREATAKLVRTFTQDRVGSEMLIFLSNFSVNAPYMFDHESSLTLLASCNDKTHTAFVSLLRFMYHTYNFEFEQEDAMDTSSADEVNKALRVPTLNFLRSSRVPPANSFALARPIVKRNLSEILSYTPHFTPFVGAEEDNNEETEIQHEVWNHMTKELYTIFWSLDLYDVFFPQELYARQIEKQEVERKLLEEKKPKTTRADEKKKLHANLQAINENIQSLKAEREVHEGRLKEIRAFIQEHVEEMCVYSSENRFMDCFLQWCVYPRCHFSIVDSLYCTKFVEIVANTKGASFSFNVITYMERVLKNAPVWLCFDTEMEAVRIGALVESCLALSNSLHNKKNPIKNETFLLNEDDEQFNHVEYNANVHHQLHSYFTGKICAVVQKQGATHHQRNALLVLNRVADVFPKYQDHATQLRGIMKKLSKRKIEGILPLIQRYENKLDKLTPSLLKHQKSVPEKPKEKPQKKKPAEKAKAAPPRSEKTPQPENARLSSPPAASRTSPKAKSEERMTKESRRDETQEKDIGGISFVAKPAADSSKPARAKREKIAPPPSVTEVQKKSLRGSATDRGDDRTVRRDTRRFERHSPSAREVSREFPPRRGESGRGAKDHSPHEKTSRDNTPGRNFRPSSNDRRGSGGWDSRGKRGASREGRGNMDGRRSTGDDRDSRRDGGGRYNDRRKRSRDNDDMSGGHGRKSYRDNNGRRGYR